MEETQHRPRRSWLHAHPLPHIQQLNAHTPVRLHTHPVFLLSKTKANANVSVTVVTGAAVSTINNENNPPPVLAQADKPSSLFQTQHLQRHWRRQQRRQTELLKLLAQALLLRRLSPPLLRPLRSQGQLQQNQHQHQPHQRTNPRQPQQLLHHLPPSLQWTKRMKHPPC